MNFQRSAIAPVGMVAAVSMNTIWNKNSVATAGVKLAKVRKKPCVPNSPNGLPAMSTTNSLRQRGVTAESRQRADAAHLETEAERPEAENADRVDQKVHGHDVGRVLLPAQAGFDERKPGLHEHHQESADQRPDDVRGASQLR